MTIGIKWPAEHAAYLRTIYVGSVVTATMTAMINEKFGANYTNLAVRGKATTLGLTRNFSYSARVLPKKWTDADMALLISGRKLGQTYAAIAAQLGGKFSTKAVSARGLYCSLTSADLGLPRNQRRRKIRVSFANPAPINPVIVTTVIPPICDENPDREPQLSPAGPDGFVADTIRNIRNWCRWAGLNTDGTDIDTRVNKVRRLHNRAPFVVVAA